MKYFIFNKDLDYERGVCSNLLTAKGAIRAKNPDSCLPGIFLSRILDSREEETVWHRLVMESACGDNMAVRQRVYAADSAVRAAMAWERCRQCCLEEVAGNDADAGSCGTDGTEDCLCLETGNPQDILLHQVRGRYLWFVLLLHGNGSGSPVIRDIRLYFPKETWMRFLPEIYQGAEGEFLERYLCIFQSVYDSLGEKIRQDAISLDLQAADPQQLLQLSGWLCAGSSHLWKPEHLKQYLKTGAMVYKNLGTAGALERMVELYTGFKPYLREPGTGDNPHLLRLYIMEEAVAAPRQYQALLRIIREGKPADIEVQVIPLKSFVFLDQDTYLGINSVLNQYGQAVLDSGSSIPYAVLGGREK